MVCRVFLLLLARVCSAALLSVAGLAHAATVEVDIEGLDKPLEQAVRGGLELQQYAKRSATAAVIRHLYDNAPAQISAALEPFGYFSPSVHSQLTNQGDTFHATFSITAGRQVKVSRLEVRVEGEGASQPAVQAALEAFKPARGAVLVSSQYEGSKAAVGSALASVGFLDAKEVMHTVKVSRESASADVAVVWASGPRYRLGPVNFSGGQLALPFLRRFVPWSPGDFYTSDELLTLQQRLVATGYFASVSVLPDLQAASGAIVPVNVQLRPGRRNAYAASVLYGTDTGPGVSGAYERRWLNRYGHKLIVQGEYAQRLQLFALDYRMPYIGSHQRTLDFGAAFVNANTTSFTGHDGRFVANETEQWEGFTRRLGLQYLIGSFKVGGESGSTSMLFPDASLSRKVVDNPQFVGRGYSLLFDLRGAPGSVLNDTGFGQMFASGKWVHSFGHERIVLRGEAGGMVVRHFDKLPPELRFFAGGDYSIRGFSYESIGSRNALGGVMGGKYLAVQSTEFQHFFLPKWGVATFFDVGDAFSGSDFVLHGGTGVGVLWRSPVGMVRLYAGKGVLGDTGHGYRIHVVIGPAL